MTNVTAPSGRRSRRPRSSQQADSAAESLENSTESTLEPATAPSSDYTPTGFARIGVPENVDRGLFAAGFLEPFKIQTEAIPVALTGVDVCGGAKTGSGKTLAFGVPMLSRITKALPMHPTALVIVPTRELALQVAEVLEPVAKVAGRTVLATYGGSSRPAQVAALKKGIDVIVATPLRLVDLIKEGDVSLDKVEVLVADEADRMADEGFLPQVEWLLRHVTGKHQTMLFSATLDGDVGHLIRHYLTDPVTIAVDDSTATVGTMHHVFLAVHRMDKDKVIASIAKGKDRIVVFCPTKRQCDRATDALRDLGVEAAAIHGDLPQPAREKALKRFSNGDLHILVATDVAARGIDVDDIDAVIHYEPATDHKSYLHRSGRTARAGKDGWAVTLAEYNQHLAVRMVQRALRFPIQDPIEVFSNNPKLKDLAQLEMIPAT
jgi:superfamily II DNA/RNA helicase